MSSNAVLASGEVHAYRGVIYDRNGDADVRVRSVAAKSLMILRKQSVFTERRIYPYVTKADLNLADLKRLRIRAQNNSRDGRRHPWMDMDDDQLLRSAKLIGTDRESGKSGFNLAAVMLLGTEDVIKDICPAYVTDAILRIENVDRYDDRDRVSVNLIAAYDRLMDFARKHLPDPFFLEGDVRKSLREIIVREMVANTLIHREFTSSRPAQFVIERDFMYVENACRAASGDELTPESFVPDPKNPIIASFFREIGYADQLGSGVRNLFKYAKAYGGADPQLTDGDVFRIEVSLKAARVAQAGTGKTVGTTEETGTTTEETHGTTDKATKTVSGATKKTTKKVPGTTKKDPGTTKKTTKKVSGTTKKNTSETSITTEEPLKEVSVSKITSAAKIISVLREEPNVTLTELAARCGLTRDGVFWNVRRLKEKGVVRRIGPDKGGHWEVVE